LEIVGCGRHEPELDKYGDRLTIYIAILFLLSVNGDLLISKYVRVIDTYN